MEKKPFGVGSKSQRNAVSLRTAAGEGIRAAAAGRQRVPRSELDALVGKEIEGGVIVGYTLILSDCRIA